MQIAVRGRHVEVPEHVKAHAHERLARLERFLEGMDTAEVRFTEEKNPRIADRETCEVTLHGHGHVVRAKASATDICAAVDRVANKLEHSLEKLKGKLVGRSHPRRSTLPSKAAPPGELPADLLEGEPAEITESQNGADHSIIRTKRFEMKPMTPDEAALQMDLLGHAFFLFTSSENGRAAVVYHRNDGEIGMIEAI
ncbi:MAG TPA: ribosome-associated translation inhibitor RaiA [Acidimicrobiales bacterium]|nr:ribosome-associated translation inhibitor RaiA [Acidimicrobiales bacterium]